LSLPSNTSEQLSQSGINLNGIIDREIMPNQSMAVINPLPDGGKWHLLSGSRKDIFWPSDNQDKSKINSEILI
jgi:hypothetical protein